MNLLLSYIFLPVREKLTGVSKSSCLVAVACALSILTKLFIVNCIAISDLLHRVATIKQIILKGDNTC